MKSCVVCATAIERAGRKGGPLPTYCSSQCKNQARREREAANGAAEARKILVRQRRAREAVQRSERLCPYCNDRMSQARRVQCGKPECTRRAKAERMRDYMRSRRADPELARKHLEYDRKAQRKRLDVLGHWRVIYPERAARADAERRMRVAAARVEVFAPRDVYTRDEWQCQLCRRAIDPATVWPDPMSASIDHIIPLAKGGVHSMGNVQAAHLSCNSRKCDRLDVPEAAALDHEVPPRRTLGGAS